MRLFELTTALHFHLVNTVGNGIDLALKPIALIDQVIFLLRSENPLFLQSLSSSNERLFHSSRSELLTRDFQVPRPMELYANEGGDASAICGIVRARRLHIRFFDTSYNLGQIVFCSV